MLGIFHKNNKLQHFINKLKFKTSVHHITEMTKTGSLSEHILTFR